MKRHAILQEYQKTLDRSAWFTITDLDTILRESNCVDFATNQKVINEMCNEPGDKPALTMSTFPTKEEEKPIILYELKPFNVAPLTTTHIQKAKTNA